MKLQQNTKRYKEFTTGDVVYFNGVRMTVYRPSWYDLERSDIRVAVASPSGKISAIHFEDLEVEVPEVPEVPEPKAPEYEGTSWHVCSKTGDLFYFSKAEGWYICVNNMVPPLHWDSDKDARVKDLKRLYREA